MAITSTFAPRIGSGPSVAPGNRFMTALAQPTAVNRAAPTHVMTNLSGPASTTGGYQGQYGGTMPAGTMVHNTFGNTRQREKAATLATGQQASTAAQNQSQARNTFTGLLNQDPSKVLSAYVSGAMPQFMQQLQGIRENDIARGISTGDLGTAYEGSLASAFQRNIASQAAGLYGTQLGAAQGLYGLDTGNNQAMTNMYANMLGGIAGQEQQDKAQKQAMLGGILGTIGNLGSAALLHG